MKSISPNLNIMIKACEKASKILIRDFGELENLQVSIKGPKDFVTSADRKVEKTIINELSKKKYSIISEEIGTKIKEDESNFWIIDPIDGTTNFLHGVPHFCISIALAHKNEIISDSTGKFQPIIVVKDGSGGKLEDPPNLKVDGITGGTITSKGVEEMTTRTLEVYANYFKSKN